MPSPSILLVILLGLSCLGNLALGKLYLEAHADYEVEKDRYKSFVGATKLAGDAQNKKAKEAKEKDDKLKKEQDDKRKKEMDSLTTKYAAANAELRKFKSSGNPGGSKLPPFALQAGKSEKAICNPAIIAGAISDYRQELFDAYTDLRQETYGILKQGDTAITDIKDATEWASKLDP